MVRNSKTIIGVLSACVCCVCVFLYTQSVQNQITDERARLLAEYGGEQIEVYVARNDIQAGEYLSANSVEKKLWLVDLLPASAITNIEDVIGKQCSSSILAGEVLSAKRFQVRSSVLEVPQGFVAVSVSAKDVQALGGAVTPGMYVDVYASGSLATSCIARNVQVLATSNSENANLVQAGSIAWVCLAVPPESVEEIIAAEQKTQLYFALPNAQVVEVGHE